MKDVLGIIASPRRTGNSELLVKAVSQSIPEPHRLHLLRLSDFRIKPCRACYLCLFKKERCILRDDLYAVIDAFARADGILLAAPTYFLGPNASLKRLLDRGLAFYAFIEQLWGKPSVGAGIAGIDGKEGYTRLGIESFLRLTMTKVRCIDILYAALPGELLTRQENRTKVRMLGTSLFGDTQHRGEPSCPLCGGDTFRFLPGGTIRCMLCSSSGTIESKEPLAFHTRKDDHPLFLTLEDALRHREWLRSEVKRYAGSRKQLKNEAAPYAGIGVWIKPETHREVSE